MLHFRGKDLVVSGKVLIISELLSKINYVELKEHLLAVYPSKDQIFLLPSTDTVDLPLSSMSVEQIEGVIFKKQSNEVRAIVGRRKNGRAFSYHQISLKVLEQV